MDNIKKKNVVQSLISLGKKKDISANYYFIKTDFKKWL